MISITALSKKEKNKLSIDNTMVVLFDLLFDNEQIYITPNNENVQWRGNLYMAVPVDIDNIGEDNTGAEPSIALTISNVVVGLQYQVEQEQGGVGTQVVVRVVNTKNLNGEADIEEFFTIIGCQVTDQNIKFTLGSGYSIKSRRPLDRYMKNNCRFAYKGCRCGYNGDLPTCTHTLSDCRKHNNSERFGGFPAIDQKGIYTND